MFRNLSIRNKILLPTCTIVAVAMLGTSLLLASWMGDAEEEDARALARQTAERHAVEVLDFINPIMDQARALAAFYESAIISGNGVDRNQFNDAVRHMVVREKSFLGVWACFEPNGFDGQDALWRNADKAHDETGRYQPYYFRTGSGIDVRPCGSAEDGLWYTVPRDTRQDYLTAPYSYDVGGKTVLGIDSCIPVLVDGRFRGAVGIDYNVTQFMEMAADITPFGTGRAYIVADDATFVGHPDEAMMAKPMSEGFGAGTAKTIAAALADGKVVDMDIESGGEEVYRVFVPIDVTGKGQYWGLGVDIPMDVVLAGSRALLYRSVGIALGVVLVLFGVIWLLARAIADPIRRASLLAELVRRGDLSERLDYESRDEIGHFAKALNAMADGLEQKARLAQAIAANDLTREVHVASDKDVLGKALRRMSENLNDVLGSVLQSALEVDSGSGQVSEASEALSQGATEQAASLEQITSSLTEVSSQTKENAENASRASRNADAVRGRAEQGNQDLERMVDAMHEVSESSEAIAKIIKVIDEIAFQTNLLALNAAVEAARAGKHGKGFAVVAEEVRNLASRSAKAAQETTALIEGSADKVRDANKLVGHTAEGLKAVVTDVAEVADLVQAIATASTEQSQALVEVTQGLQQVDTVTQRNTANAEQTSSAAQELSSQAGMLRSILANFRLREGAGCARTTGAPRAAATRYRAESARPQPLPGSAPRPDAQQSRNGRAEARTGTRTGNQAGEASGSRRAAPETGGQGASGRDDAASRGAWGPSVEGEVDPETVISLDDDEFGRY